MTAIVISQLLAQCKADASVSASYQDIQAHAAWMTVTQEEQSNGANMAALVLTFLRTSHTSETTAKTLR